MASEPLRAIAVSVALLLPVPAAAEAGSWKPFPVPQKVAARQQLVAVPPGWTAGEEERPHVLAGVTIFDGPPADLASLVGEGSAKRGGKMVSTWLFPEPFPKGAWITALYAGTTLTLTRRIPDGVRELRVTYDPKVTVDGYPSIEKIEIR